MLSPTAAWNWVASHLPNSISALISNLAVVIAWLALPLSLASAFKDIVETAGFFRIDLGSVPLNDALSWLSRSVFEVGAFWRQLTEPLFQKIEIASNLAVPRFAFDLTLMSFFVLPTWLLFGVAVIGRRRHSMKVQELKKALGAAHSAKLEIQKKRRSATPEEVVVGGAVGQTLGGLLGPLASLVGGALGATLAAKEKVESPEALAEAEAELAKVEAELVNQLGILESATKRARRAQVTAIFSLFAAFCILALNAAAQR